MKTLIREVINEKAHREKCEARELHALLREQEWRERLRRVGALVEKWRWIPELVFVVGVCIYVGFAVGIALFDWGR